MFSFYSDFTDTKAIEVLEELGTSPASAEDVSVLRYACAIVSNRAAKIIVSGWQTKLCTMLYTLLYTIYYYILNLAILCYILFYSILY